MNAHPQRRSAMLRLAISTCLAVTGLSTFAQGVVRSQAAYPDDADKPLPFAAPPEQKSAAHMPVATERSQEQPMQTWEVRVSDVRLENTFARWAAAAGYTLLWDADRHVLISAADAFSGDFLAAVDRVLKSPAISQSDYPLEAVVYANHPPVLRITRDGEQSIKE